MFQGFLDISVECRLKTTALLKIRTRRAVAFTAKDKMPLHTRTIIFVLALSAVAYAQPGRVPKVYNALITSSQNLSPSKAFPVYQPYVQQFGYPYLGAPYYGTDFEYPQVPQQQGMNPIVVQQNQPEGSNTRKQGNSDNNDGQPPATNNPPTNDGQGQQPQTPPSTESPIPLNQFGLPPHVIPLNKFNPQANFPQPYDPFALNPFLQPNQYEFNPYYFTFDQNPYSGLPPIYNIPGQELETPKGNIPIPIPERRSDNSNNAEPKDEKKRENNETELKTNADNSTPPPAPTNLDVTNITKKDPNIPDVPPPPLPQGGLKQ